MQLSFSSDAPGVGRTGSLGRSVMVQRREHKGKDKIRPKTTRAIRRSRIARVPIQIGGLALACGVAFAFFLVVIGDEVINGNGFPFHAERLCELFAVHGQNDTIRARRHLLATEASSAAATPLRTGRA